MMTTTNMTEPKKDSSDHDYKHFLKRIQEVFDESTQDLENSRRLFLTSVPRGHLMATFLPGLPAELRQFYTCNCCGQFLDRFGALVRVNDAGEVQSVLWSNPGDFPPIFQEAVRRMKELVERQAIEDVFMTDAKVLGTPVTGSWEHMSVQIGQKFRTKRRGILQLSQMQAEKREDVRMLRGILEYRVDEVAAVHAMLNSDKLYRASRHLDWAEWLLGVRKQLEETRHSEIRNRILWLRASEAPQGWCHIGSSMVGLLLQGVREGKTGQELADLYSQLMNPLQYQRPTAAPKSGAIDRAEKVVQELGLARSFERRFARLEDCQTLWRPREEEPEGGMFGHLRKKEASPELQLTETTRITWNRFRRTILPTALEIRLVERAQGYAFTAPAHPDSPNLFQWGNPIAWYTRSTAFLVSPGRVRAIILFPFMWENEERFRHQTPGVLFAVEGAQDPGPHDSSALFPEFLRSEFHEIRSVVEAHSKSTRLQGDQDGAVVGPAIREGFGGHSIVTLQVRSEGGVSRYVIDRWD